MLLVRRGRCAVDGGEGGWPRSGRRHDRSADRKQSNNGAARGLAGGGRSAARDDTTGRASAATTTAATTTNAGADAEPADACSHPGAYTHAATGTDADTHADTATNTYA